LSKGVPLLSKEEAKDQEQEQKPLREISEEELKKVIAAHKEWVESEGKEGKRADLSRTDLSKANLIGAVLRGADLKKANLQGAHLWKANLREANLEKADLREAILHKANLQEANLRGADLRGVVRITEIKDARNWREAVYDADFRAKLGITQEEADKVRKELGLPSEAEEAAQKRADAEKKSPK